MPCVVYSFQRAESLEFDFEVSMEEGSVERLEALQVDLFRGEPGRRINEGRTTPLLPDGVPDCVGIKDLQSDAIYGLGHFPETPPLPEKGDEDVGSVAAGDNRQVDGP